MRTLLLALLVAVPSAQAETRHTVVAGDTLWALAGHYYKDSFAWRRIADANPAPSVKDPHWIYPGQVLVIPDVPMPAEEPGPALGPDTEAQDVPKAAPEPAEEPAVEAPSRAPEPEPEVQAKAAPPPVFDPALGGVALPDALSKSMPVGQTGQSPALRRLVMPQGWTEDGSVLEGVGREQAAQGDGVIVLLEGKDVSRRQRFGVFRRSGPTEADTDDKALYMQKVGLVEIVKKLPKEGRYRALVLGSGDTIQPGDLLKREE